MNEGEAISRLKQGDIRGLEILVRKYQVQAVRAAYLVTHDRHLAEDIVQTAFLRAYEKRQQFDSAKPFGPWFFRIVVNDAAKAVAQRNRQVSLDRKLDGEEVVLADLLADPNPGPEELAEQAETRQSVREALGKLSPSERAAVVFKYYLELKETEIAERIGRAPGTVKWLLHTARKRLQVLLRPVLSREATNRQDEGRK